MFKKINTFLQNQWQKLNRPMTPQEEQNMKNWNASQCGRKRCKYCGKWN